MNVRRQIAKLRHDIGAAGEEETVRAISKIMDELSAAAAGGGAHHPAITLDHYFEPYSLAESTPPANP
jgi:hypothetical protein